ncbi:MFS transporter [Streptomyces sp. NBC_00825]|uniref:MFS transporter n=1 Tax=unclassified Streptomyces TaxID=2593676 RepID=UPI002255A93B|nr:MULTISPECIES: MFS transporter [unclassified Streptomyces]WTB59136.1 MFS transporter [Streptomyces sp. NBC_00826]WTH87990.1 MFS transporter [Streptomyces sp. NBC_00825]WTH96717.1 MFS transporter [Streptomyces sp. NBC_00822]MCX4870199.1 MFS transporter [Streptomyces sp. NBC_00906]MCX4901363.1 MFS transporter [Streptomyces sp. NBC_00892]
MKKRYSLRVYLVGAVAARAGDEASGPALMLAGFALTGSTTDASSLLAGITISAAVGGPVLGTLLDRASRPGRLLAGALVVYAAGLGAILAGLGHLPFAVTILIAVLTGMPAPALSGGWTAQLPRVVPDDGLPRANMLDAMTYGAASLAGPALAGVAAELLGAPTAVVVSAGLIGLALPTALMLPARPVREHVLRKTAVVSDLVAGFRAIVRQPPLARATLTSVVSCVAQGMLTACAVFLGEHVLGGAGRGAMLLSGAAVSALVANAVLARFPYSLAPDTIIWAGALVQAAAVVLATSEQPSLLVVAVLVLGIGEGPQLAALFAVRHREAPEHLRGQIFTTGASLKITGFALGAAVAGPIATWSLRGALALAASVAVFAALAFFVVPSTADSSSEDRAISH